LYHGQYFYKLIVRVISILNISRSIKLYHGGI